MNLFNHVQIKVKDLDRSRKFYEPLIKILGYPRVLKIDKIVFGYGTSVHNMFEIRQEDNEARLSHAVHIAFNASSMKSVDTFYQTAIEKGAQCNGSPGLRPEYEKQY
jgi:predicted lactoylglutathione lyase